MNVRLSIFLCVLLLILGGGVLITQIFRVDDSALPDRKERLYMLDKADMVEVRVLGYGREISFLQEEDGWFIKDEEGGDDSPVDIQRWGGVPDLLEGPQAADNLSRDNQELEDLASYGLDPPAKVIKLITNNPGSEIEIHIGEVTPTTDGYYVKIASTDTIFVAHLAWVDVILGLLLNPPYMVDEE